MATTPQDASTLQDARIYKVRSRTPKSSDAPIPLLRMSGKWLAEIGFLPGAVLLAFAEPGRLVLVLAPKFKRGRPGKPVDRHNT